MGGAQGTQGNSRELKETQGNSRELKGTLGFSKEALVEVMEGNVEGKGKIRQRTKKLREKSPKNSGQNH